MPAQLPLLDRDALVMVGSGSKAHVFRSHPKANLKLMELRDGATVYDIAVCGARGAMVAAPEGTDVCASCKKIVTED